MKIQGVDMVMIMVRDFEHCLAWYQEVLGLKLRSKHGEFAYLETGNIPLALHGGAGDGDVPADRGTLAVLLVDDYEASKAELEAHGSEFTFENTTPHAVFGTFHDPEGNALQILERTG